MLLQYYFQKAGPPTFPVEVDLSVYLEFLGGINLDGVFNIEYLQNVSVSAATILEYLGSLTPADFPNELEWLQGINGDLIVPIEYIGTDQEALPIGLLKWTILNKKKVWIVPENNTKTWTATKNKTWTL